MNEEVMCGHPAEVLWTSCRGYVVRKVGIELLWQLKRLQNSYEMLKRKGGEGKRR